MKKFCKILGISLLITTSVTAQPGSVTGTRYGKGQDSITCIRNLSLYRSDYDHRNYDAAIVNWRKVWRDCPQSSANLAIHGMTMYKFFLARELDQNRKKALVDTLVKVYRKGVELRPMSRGSYLENLAHDMVQYEEWLSPENQANMIKTLEEAMLALKEKTLAKTYAIYMQNILAKNVGGALSDEELLENYTKVSDYISDAINKTSNEELAKVRDIIDDSFAGSLAASCENLLKIYGDKYDANKNDAEFLRKLTRMLIRKECTDSELYEKAAEQQYALNPSPDAAYNMAMLFLRRDNFEKAVEYFENAIERETNPFEKARYNHMLGQIMLSKYSRYSEAKKYAIEASKLRPNWGAPYILLAQTYASGPKCGDDDFENRYVWWVAVDKLQRAKAVDPDVSNTADQLIREYTRHFPKKEDGFFRGITEGTVNVGCWIGESTKVRYAN